MYLFNVYDRKDDGRETKCQSLTHIDSLEKYTYLRIL